jgi:ABC-2 type transport system ATP-binding protein
MDIISIQTKALHKRFGANEALKGISIDFTPGIMHGVIGPEGAGKTTLMRHLLGLLRPTSGSLSYFKNQRQVDFEEVRAEIAYMPQQQSLYPDLSIDEHLQFFGSLYRLPKEVYEKKKQELLRITRLEAFQDRPAGKLSGGMYKKLGLMCSLLRSPAVLILDEPTNGVDPISRREFWELLYQLTAQKILIILTTAYMDEAERCTHVHLLEAGKVLSAGDPRELMEAEHVKSFDELFLKHAASLEQAS